MPFLQPHSSSWMARWRMVPTRPNLLPTSSIFGYVKFSCESIPNCFRQLIRSSSHNGKNIPGDRVVYIDCEVTGLPDSLLAKRQLVILVAFYHYLPSLIGVIFITIRLDNFYWGRDTWTVLQKQLLQQTFSGFEG